MIRVRHPDIPSRRKRFGTGGLAPYFGRRKCHLMNTFAHDRLSTCRIDGETRDIEVNMVVGEVFWHNYKCRPDHKIDAVRVCHLVMQACKKRRTRENLSTIPMRKSSS